LANLNNIYVGSAPEDNMKMIGVYESEASKTSSIED